MQFEVNSFQGHRLDVSQWSTPPPPRTYYVNNATKLLHIRSHCWQQFTQLW